MLATWGDSTDEEEGSKEEEEAVALMARSETDSDEESSESLDRLKNKVCRLNKEMPKEFLFTVMDECDTLYSENCELKGACAELKRDIRELDHENKILKDEKIELDMKNLVLRKDLERIKETFKLKEESLVTDFTKLEKESLELKQKAKSLLVENHNLHEKIKQVEKYQAANRRWHDSSQALNWLNNHHNRGRKGLGFVKKHTVYPCNRKYVGLPENIVCYYCEKIGHVRYSCPSRERAFKRNYSCVKQIWVRKEDLSMLQGMGPKQIWVPKINN